MRYSDAVRKAVREGRLDVSKPDLGVGSMPDACEMPACDNKKQSGSPLCASCYAGFGVALNRLQADVAMSKSWDRAEE